MEKVGAASSFTMVPSTLPVPMFAPLGPPVALVISAVNVSSSSNVVSVVVCTVNVWDN